MKRRYSRITGTGSALPERVVTNDELARDLAQPRRRDVRRMDRRAHRHSAALYGRTGNHHGGSRGEGGARRARVGQVDVGSIDLIVVATSTPDQIFPSCACLIQAQLEAGQLAAFDVQAVCSGFVYALAVADAMIRSGMHRRALVIGTEVFSRILDWNDRTTCVLFGDGAGAVVLEAAGEPGLIAAS